MAYPSKKLHYDIFILWHSGLHKLVCKSTKAPKTCKLPKHTPMFAKWNSFQLLRHSQIIFFSYIHPPLPPQKKNKKKKNRLFFFFLENRLCCSVQIVSFGDNLHKMFQKKNKKNISKCNVLKFLLCVQNIKLQLVTVFSEKTYVPTMDFPFSTTVTL